MAEQEDVPEVVVVDVQIPFGRMVVLSFMATFAAIPVGLMIGGVLWVLGWAAGELGAAQGGTVGW